VKRLGWVALVGALALTFSSVLAVQQNAEAAVATTTIQDTAQGTGVGQVQFSAGWSPCSGNCTKAPDNSFQWTSTAGSSATVRFSGHQIKLFGVKEPWAYIATAAIDGGTAVDVDYYAAEVTATTVEVYSSPTLTEGSHTLVLTMTNRKNPASSGGNSITFDRAEVASDTSSPHASGLPWSDGGYFMHDGDNAAAFANWRGRPVDNIVVFPAREAWNNLLSTWWTQSIPSSFSAGRDDLIVSIPLWTQDNDLGTDANWSELAQGIAEADPNAYVRLGWEMNCCEFSKAKAGQEAAWRNQFSRAATLLKATAPGLKIVFNPNEGTSGYDEDEPFVEDASTLFVDGKVDVIALDAYDWYPAYNSDGNADNHFTKQYGWNWWYNFARSKGLPFAIAEFSVYSRSPDSGGDNPAYFTYVYNWLASKNTTTPGSIAFVSVFNEADPYCLCNVYPTDTNPNAAARYRSIIQALSQ